jgi:shikimate dehydrogenase
MTATMNQLGGGVAPHPRFGVMTPDEDRRRSMLLGLIGQDISGSLTPAMQEREGDRHGLRISYRIIDAGLHRMGADDLSAILAWAERFGFDGLNITHPFKQAVIPMLDELSPDAADIGAVNTIVFDDGRRLGHNTDWWGYGRAFRAAVPDATTDEAVVVGAGGAGVAVGYALLEQGAAHVDFFDVDPSRARTCVSRLERKFGQHRVGVAENLGRALERAQGVVNATPVGMLGHEGVPVPESFIRPDLWVSDVVYFPLETELIRLARSRGCRVVPGGGMAVQQAVGAFEHFTGDVADSDRMTAHFEELTATS